MSKRNRSQYEADDDIYTGNGISLARSALLQETCQGRMRSICQRYFLNKSQNLWEGEDGMMEHANLPFPMPELLTVETSEDGKDDVQTCTVNDEQSFDSSQSKKSLSSADDGDTDNTYAAANISSSGDSSSSENQQGVEHSVIEVSDSSSVEIVDVEAAKKAETAMDGQLLSKGEKQSKGAGDGDSGGVSNQSKKIIAWEQLIMFYTELLEMQNTPLVCESLEFEAQILERKKRLCELEKLVNVNIANARLRPKHKVPLELKRRKKLRHRFKVSGIFKLLKCEKESVKNWEDFLNYSELDYCKDVVSVYEEVLKIKKNLERFYFDSHLAPRGEFVSYEAKMENLRKKFNNACLKAKQKGFEEMSYSMRKQLKVSNHFTLKEICNYFDYIECLLIYQRIKLNKTLLEPNGKGRTEEGQCMLDLSRIYKNYLIIGYKLKIDFNIKKDEKVILAGENLAAAIHIKEQLEELEEELLAIEKQGHRCLSSFKTAEKTKFKVLEQYRTAMDRIANPDSIQ